MLFTPPLDSFFVSGCSNSRLNLSGQLLRKLSREKDKVFSTSRYTLMILPSFKSASSVQLPAPSAVADNVKSKMNITLRTIDLNVINLLLAYTGIGLCNEINNCNLSKEISGQVKEDRRGENN